MSKIKELYFPEVNNMAMTIGYKASLREDQNARQAVFPLDRIAFHQSSAAVGNDLKAFKQYYYDEISFNSLRRVIARNNYLETYFQDGMIPEDMMRNELKLLGWEKPENLGGEYGADN